MGKKYSKEKWETKIARGKYSQELCGLETLHINYIDTP